ncbi:T9SS type A sorting domain-containing protein [Dyadobacter sp. 676]|uniref:T9SS type A sorting domain-containing protein n=1 Tax=Dyadobacter sp. 676 TaxID=3088362 RepID=A0AAU8FKJ5_9BACT
MSCNNLPELKPEQALILTIYPNPGRERIWIYVKNDARSPFTLQIFDPEGKTIFEQEVPNGDATNGFRIDPNDFGTGAFHAVLRMDGAVYTQKFMVL